MRRHPEGCPNCKAQIVWHRDGFKCSICSYTWDQWKAFLLSTTAATRFTDLPMHTDSPALRKSGDSYQNVQVNL